MTTGERIAKKRHEKGWTQHELVKRMGLNSKSIKDWESGVSLPSGDYPKNCVNLQAGVE